MQTFKVAHPTIVYKDVFDLKRLYLLLREFLDEEHYTDDYHGDKYLEKFYQEQRSPSGKKQIRFWWRSSTQAPGGSAYFKYVINIDVVVYNMAEVDIVKNNQKVRANQGELQVKIDGKLIMDYNNYFEKSDILKPFRRIFEKILMKKDMEYHWMKVLDDVQKLELEIKTHLNLYNSHHTRRPYLESF